MNTQLVYFPLVSFFSTTLHDFSIVLWCPPAHDQRLVSAAAGRSAVTTTVAKGDLGKVN